VTNGSPTAPTTGTVAASHVYTGRGAFTVTVTVADNFGGATTRTFIVGVGSSNVYALGAGEGGRSLVRIFDSAFNQELRTLQAYGNAFIGGVRVASGDVSGDTLADVVTAPGRGGGPHIRVFDAASGVVHREFFAYDAGFTGGVYVAVGDVNDDGVGDIITGAGEGGGPHVKVFDGLTGAVIQEFFAFSPSFLGGVRVAAADVNGDGADDIIAGAGPGGGPHVIVYSGISGVVLQSFFAYTTAFGGGVFVAGGDVNDDGFADVITGPGVGGGPHLRIFDGLRGGILANNFPFPIGVPGESPFTGNNLWLSGLRVATSDVDMDNRPDIIVGAGPSLAPAVKILSGADLSEIDHFLAFDPGFLGGVFVSGN
jgi:hypothetical protein